MSCLLYQRQYHINDKISVIIPTVGEILQDESAYYDAVQFLTAQPIDFMVALDDAGIDFTAINEWELFLLLLPAFSKMDIHLLLSGIDLSRSKLMVSEQNNEIVVVDSESGAIIDRAILGQIAAVMRKIHHLEIDRRKPANEEARKYMLERARIKARRSNISFRPLRCTTARR